MKVSIIIPAFNEVKTLPILLDRLQSLDFHKEIIIVDDGSTDGTSAFLDTLNPHAEELQIIRNERNYGKGYSIRQAIEVATGEIIATQDADLEYDPQDLANLVQHFIQDDASVLYGSRILKAGNGMSYLRYYLGGRLVTLVANLLYNARLSDEPTGYKLFRKEILEQMDLQCMGFEFCPEVTGKLLKRGITIAEYPISYHPRSFKEGKKISWKDGLIAVWTLVKIRFSARCAK